MFVPQIPLSCFMTLCLAPSYRSSWPQFTQCFCKTEGCQRPPAVSQWLLMCTSPPFLLFCKREIRGLCAQCGEAPAWVGCRGTQTVLPWALPPAELPWDAHSFAGRCCSPASALTCRSQHPPLPRVFGTFGTDRCQGSICLVILLTGSAVAPKPPGVVLPVAESMLLS